MANVQINIFENAPLIGLNTTAVQAYSNYIHHVYIPGSISFNNIAVIWSATTGNNSISFGLYSLNDSTLSLANSASQATSFNGFSWVSLVTSATQNITPGDWYFGIIVSSSGRVSIVRNVGRSATGGAYGGPFVIGVYSITSAMPSSIATSGISLEGAINSLEPTIHPYILISA